MSYVRHSQRYDLTLDSVLADTPEIPFADFASGTVIVLGASVTSLTYYTCDEMGGTYQPLYDAAGNAVTQTVAQNRAYPLPVSVAGCAFLKIVTNADGEAVLTAKS